MTPMNQTIAELEVSLQNLVHAAKTHARSVAAKGLAESRDVVESSARILAAVADRLGALSAALAKRPEDEAAA